MYILTDAWTTIKKKVTGQALPAQLKSKFEILINFAWLQSAVENEEKLVVLAEINYCY